MEELSAFHPKSIAIRLVHMNRLFGWLPPVIVAAVLFPRKTIPVAVLSFVADMQLRLRSERYHKLTTNLIAFGSSNKPRLVNAQKKPYDVLNKQYMVLIHPHGVLCDAWFNLLPRLTGKTFRTEGNGCMNGLKMVLCFAPMVQHFPLHGHIYGKRCTDVSRPAVEGVLRRTPETDPEGPRGKNWKPYSVAICPGGFSESIFTGYSEDEEIAFLENRFGFIQIAVENQIDIIPTYSFGVQDMYEEPSFLKKSAQKRAELSQKLMVPFQMHLGKNGLPAPYDVPKTEDTVTVTFDPFEVAGRYVYGESATKEEKMAVVRACHGDYLRYLQECFDKYKHVTPSTRKKKLVFRGTGGGRAGGSGEEKITSKL